MELRNGTPFALAQLVDLDREGAEHLIVVLRAAYRWDDNGALAVAEAQPPPRPGDEFRDDPATSSIAAEAELGPIKPTTDVLLTGSAVARRGGTRAMDVRLKAGPIEKKARVFGDRVWKRTLGFRKPGDPEPFDRMPLIWENSYGGYDDTPENESHHRANRRNPVGRGVRGRNSGLPWDQLLPNIEDPEDLIDKPGKKVRPVGFGPIGRHWWPRRKYAGTYDDQWVAERLPLLPDDFDPRFHQAAPSRQVAKRYFRGGEAVQLTGFGGPGRVEFELPVLSPSIEVRLRSRVETAAMVLETVGFDTDERTLRLIYKAGVRVHGEFTGLRWTACELGGDLG